MTHKLVESKFSVKSRNSSLHYFLLPLPPSSLFIMVSFYPRLLHPVCFEGRKSAFLQQHQQQAGDEVIH